VVSIDPSISPAPSWIVADFDPALLLPDPNIKDNFFFRAPYNHSIKVALWEPHNRTMLRNTSQAEAINVFFRSSTRLSPLGPGTGFDAAPAAPASAPSAAFTPVRYNLTVANLDPRRVPLPLPDGALITVFPRGAHHAVAITASARTRLEDVTIYGGCSMGVVDSSGPGGTLLSRVRLNRRPLAVSASGWAGGPQLGAATRTIDRLHSVNADGFHSNSNAMGPKIVNCDVGYTGDDLGNVCSGMSIVLARRNATHLVLIDNGHNLARGRAGDALRLYHLNSQTGEALATVASVGPSTDPAMRQAAQQARQTLANPPYNTTFTDAAWANIVPYEFAFEQALPDNVTAYWTIAHLESTGNGGASILNSTFHDGYARIWMIKSRNTVVANNYFARSGGVHLGPEQVWCEGRFWGVGGIYRGSERSMWMSLRKAATTFLPLFSYTLSYVSSLPHVGDPGQTNVVIENNEIHAGGTDDTAIQIEQALLANHANITLKNNQIFPN
jgi:hypothetical protein